MANEIKKQNTPLALGTGTRLLSSESKSGTLSSTCCEAVRLLGAGQGCKAEEVEKIITWRDPGEKISLQIWSLERASRKRWVWSRVGFR